MSFETEYSFTLPRGYIDAEGNLHREGVMRLATAADEFRSLREPRVMQNPSYLIIAQLAKVITKPGSLQTVDTKVIEGLFVPDLAFLQSMYERINKTDELTMECMCPFCGGKFKAPVKFD